MEKNQNQNYCCKIKNFKNKIQKYFGISGRGVGRVSFLSVVTLIIFLECKTINGFIVLGWILFKLFRNGCPMTTPFYFRYTPSHRPLTNINNCIFLFNENKSICPYDIPPHCWATFGNALIILYTNNCGSRNHDETIFWLQLSYMFMHPIQFFFYFFNTFSSFLGSTTHYIKLSYFLSKVIRHHIMVPIPPILSPDILPPPERREYFSSLHIMPPVFFVKNTMCFPKAFRNQHSQLGKLKINKINKMHPKKPKSTLYIIVQQNHPTI